MNLKQTYKELKKYIIKNYGKRCGEFEIDCKVCQKWLMLDILLDMADMEFCFKSNKRKEVKYDK